jgi:hypothetical protein
MIFANDFRRQWLDIQEDAVAAFRKVGESGWYVLGDEVRAFEAALAAHWGVEHAIGVASGLDAIEISLKILGCMPGDPVLTTPLSAFATTLAILKLGAVPVFADTNARGLLDLDRCRDLFWRRPDIRFFVPVHLYGHALDLAALRQLREEFGVHIVEDCAQSIGARFHDGINNDGTNKSQATGTAGQFAATSFYPTKNLGAWGDGGAILTANPEWRRAIATRYLAGISRPRSTTPALRKAPNRAGICSPSWSLPIRSPLSRITSKLWRPARRTLPGHHSRPAPHGPPRLRLRRRLRHCPPHRRLRSQPSDSPLFDRRGGRARDRRSERVASRRAVVARSCGTFRFAGGNRI